MAVAGRFELVERYGGDQQPSSLSWGPVVPFRRFAPGEFDAFGAIVDGRDHYMRDLVWAAVVNWYRECPIPPSPTPNRKPRCARSGAVYERRPKRACRNSTTPPASSARAAAPPVY
jgi:hypothetical protein